MSRNGAQIEVAEDVLLDGRLALFHQKQRWLAVADLHFGFELSQCAAGNLFPLWGMQTIEERLTELTRDFRPRHLILLGDIVHDRTAIRVCSTFLAKLQANTEVVVIAGNHDRQVVKQLKAVPAWRSNGFHFHHGHCEVERASEIQVMGHHHPARVMRDGAGLRLKLPAFVQLDRCWIMPAFSPWAAGTPWPICEEERVWLCSPSRVISLGPP